VSPPIAQRPTTRRADTHPPGHGGCNVREHTAHSYQSRYRRGGTRTSRTAESLRAAAGRVASALAECPDVETIALIGFVARPLWREVPRFAPYKQLRLPIAHEGKDVDLAVWVSRIDGLEDLRRTRITQLGKSSPSKAMGRRSTKLRSSCLSRAQTAISAGPATSGNAQQVSAIVSLWGKPSPDS
jgi:hypothetical protein